MKDSGTGGLPSRITPVCHNGVNPNPTLDLLPLQIPEFGCMLFLQSY